MLWNHYRGRHRFYEHTTDDVTGLMSTLQMTSHVLPIVGTVIMKGLIY